jgi:hypothetical protein
MNEKQSGAASAGIIVAIVIVVVAGLAFFLTRNNNPADNGQNTTTPPPPPASMAPAEAPMTAQDSSGQSGKVTLTEVDGHAKVVIEIASAPKDVVQPASINLGTCAAPGSLKYNLNPVVNGRSETSLQPALHFIHGLGQLTVNVHKSESNAAAVSCGEVSDALDAVMNGSVTGSIRSEGTVQIK